jgi:hypothetical protein
VAGTIVDGITGIFFDRQGPSDLARAIQLFEHLESGGRA